MCFVGFLARTFLVGPATGSQATVLARGAAALKHLWVVMWLGGWQTCYACRHSASGQISQLCAGSVLHCRCPVSLHHSIVCVEGLGI